MKFEINLNYSLEKIYTAFFDKKSFIEAINASSIGFDIDSKDEFLLDSNFKNKESFSLFVWSKSEEEYDSVIDLIFIHESQDKFEFLITDFGVYFDEGDIADSSMFKKNIDKYLIKIKLIPLSENLTKVVVRDVLLILFYVWVKAIKRVRLD